MRNKLLYAALIFGLAGSMACNNETHESDSKDSSKISPTDIEKGDSSTAKTTAKKRGKATVAMNEEKKNKVVRGKDGVYNKVEKMPEFPGGQNALGNYVENHVQYPDQAVNDNVTGTVRVSFVVDEHGNVKDPKLIGKKQLGDGLDDEAIRVVSEMPNWKPGQVRGKNVKTRLELPITFEL